MNAVDLVWMAVDRVCPPAPVVEPSMAVLKARVDARYPDVMIWKKGEVVASGGYAELTMYPATVGRILYRAFRGGPRYTGTFYWNDGAWASVCFASSEELWSWLCGTAATLLHWPKPEAL